LGWLIVLTLITVGCKPGITPPTGLPTQTPTLTGKDVQPAQANTPTGMPSPAQSATPVLASSGFSESRNPVPLAAAPSPMPDPLRFTFPTAGPEPVSGWRPPLYPIPWEPTPQDHFYFARPIGADEINWPLAKYRYGGVFFADEAHTGIDIPAPTGTPVLAAGSGKVIWAGYGLYNKEEVLKDPYGLAIAIKHDFGYKGETLYSIYGHMESIVRFRGQRVETGEMIGVVGETGNVTGPHLHFEIRIGDNTFFKSRNPELWLSPPQGWGVLAARILNRDGLPLERHTVNLRSLETNQYWYVITYGEGSVNNDPYYRENMVIGDLPAGEYEVFIEYEEVLNKYNIEVLPGMVTFFRYVGSEGFELELPPTPDPGFIPPDFTPSPSPTP
jgi:murein DD-endopeptidase MepM/ murein hydrolase activator NlpD